MRKKIKFGLLLLLLVVVLNYFTVFEGDIELWGVKITAQILLLVTISCIILFLWGQFLGKYQNDGILPTALILSLFVLYIPICLFIFAEGVNSTLRWWIISVATSGFFTGVSFYILYYLSYLYHHSRRRMT